jgi:Domain of unknown function (DUF4349)/Putative zinc-finger
MITAAHPVAPEDLMALLDGELPMDEASAVSAHLEHCVECGEIVAPFRAVSRSLSSWTIPEASSKLEESVMTQAALGLNSTNLGRTTRLSIWNWRVWAIGGGGAVAAALILVAAGISLSYYEERPKRALSYLKVQPQPTPSTSVDEYAMTGGSRQRAATEQMYDYAPAEPLAANPMATRAPGSFVAKSGLIQSDALQSASAGTAMKKSAVVVGGASSTPAANTPMIARTVDLNIEVKDFPAARSALEAIMARHNGYSAHLSVSNTDNTPRILQDSLRIPSSELAAALMEIKALGRVVGETQAGEEVTQQHADLGARLQNSRETEQRLRDILAQRTGKIEDVLQVEEEIARVRGEIEGMESDQKTLEHRVDFASVDLSINEEYKEQFKSPSTSVSTQIGNAFVTGMRNAASMLLGVILFIEEAGPAVLIWLIILGVPAFVVWRRYRRMKAKV